MYHFSPPFWISKNGTHFLLYHGLYLITRGNLAICGYIAIYENIFLGLSEEMLFSEENQLFKSVLQSSLLQEVIDGLNLS